MSTLTPCFSLSQCRKTFLFAAAVFYTASTSAAGAWGTYPKPYSAQSPWNSRPVSPVLGDFEIPRSDYYPAVSEGKWSTGVFLASAGDKPMQVSPLPGRPGIWDPDAESHRDSITIPRWPEGVLPAAGADGHADIVDPIDGIVHSFFQLKNIDGQWRANQYAWTRLGGRGWGEPGHYFQGARAAGVPSMGGLIRKHEIDDGDAIYRHALAVSLTYNAMSAGPTYIFPATSADTNAAKTNTGRIPEGALIMLPQDYNTTHIHNERLRKVAETLKIYGGYVVDRNVGTPFAIYVENGSNFKLHGPKWDNEVARELDRIRAALRQVVRTSGWMDGDGKPMEMERRLNLLSMRGPWRVEQGGGAGTFDTWQQAVVFGPGAEAVSQVNTSGRSLNPVAWARPAAGEKYRLTAQATGGGRLRLQLTGAGGAKLYDSGELEDGKSAVFDWPDGQSGVAVVARSGGNGRASSVSGTLQLVQAPNAEARR